MHIHSQYYCIEVSDCIHELLAMLAVDDAVDESQYWLFGLL
jgi:hypothetical protein